MSIVYSQDPKVKALREDALAKLKDAEHALHAYWTSCEIGDEREWGANLFEIVRTAPREARS